MAHVFKGDIKVGRTGIFDRRADQGLLASAISTALAITRHDARWQDITASGGTQIVNLPDATLLPNGWEVVINAQPGDDLDVQDNGGNPLQVVVAGVASGAFMFTLLDNGTSDGVWYVTALENPQTAPAGRFVITHDATTDWTDQGTYWDIQTTAAVHGRGVNPVIQFYEDVGAGVLNQVSPDLNEIQTNGDQSTQVPSGLGNTPDLRYAGQIVFI